jgi:hypothetical protein
MLRKYTCLNTDPQLPVLTGVSGGFPDVVVQMGHNRFPAHPLKVFIE